MLKLTPKWIKTLPICASPLVFSVAVGVSVLLMLQVRSVASASSDGAFTIFAENDGPQGYDSNYTSGVRLLWVSEPFADDESNFLDKNLGFLAVSGNLGFKNHQPAVMQRSVALTHLMYTASDPHVVDPPRGEHPYAGWFGVSYGTSSASENALSSAEISLGILGPAALAEEVQDTFHSITGAPKFSGWDSQIPNELTLNFYFDTKRRLEWMETGQRQGFATDGLWNAGLALGNFRTHARLGTTMRAGWHLPHEIRDFRIGDAAKIQQGFQSWAQPSPSSWSCYGFLGAEVRGILHDAVLDGPVFRSYDTDVSKKPVVADVFIGLSYRYKRLELSYTHTLQTDRFETQQEHGGYSTFFVSLSY